MRTLIGVLALVLVGCQQPVPTVITNTNTNSNILNGGGGLTNPDAPATTCVASEEVPIRVDITAPLTVAVGSNGGIDATPKSAAGKRSDGCNITQGIFWMATPVDVCSVPQPTAFTTVVKCTKVGACQLTASVPGRSASGTATVACQ